MKNETLYLVLGAAVLGYFAYKKGLLKSFGVQPPPLAQSAAPALSSPNDVAVVSPSFADPGITAPQIIDITGEQVKFF